MTSWDEHALANDQVQDFLQEIQEEYEDAGADSDVETVVTALEDAVVIAQKQAARGDEDYAVGLAAASIAAIWSGAPYSISELADEYSVIRGGIGRASEVLQERAAQLLEDESEALEEAGLEVPEGLETYHEALS